MNKLTTSQVQVGNFIDNLDDHRLFYLGRHAERRGQVRGAVHAAQVVRVPHGPARALRPLSPPLTRRPRLAPPTPRSSWTKRLITAYDYAAVQINVGDVDPATGRYTQSSKPYALCGYIRDKVRAIADARVAPRAPRLPRTPRPCAPHPLAHPAPLPTSSHSGRG